MKNPYFISQYYSYFIIPFFCLLTLIRVGHSEPVNQSDVIQQMQAQIQAQMQTLQAMQERLNEVEKQNQEFREQIKTLNASQSVSASPAPASQIPGASPSAGSSKKEEKAAVTSSFPIDLYGYLKFSSSYDTSRIDNGNRIRWVESDSVSPNDDEFNASASESRFGLRFHGPDVGSMKTSGRAEVDFLGGGSETSSVIRMRHAYAQLNWPDYDLSVLAGQTTDIISPLFPSVVNQYIHWYIGNIGSRRPQLRVTKGLAIDEDSKLVFEGGFTRTIGDDMFAFDPGDTGEDAGFPTMQGRISYTFPLLTDKPTTFGVSGHWGQEEIDLDAFDHSRNMDSWSANVDVTLPLIDKVQLKGEAFIGENLDAYAGGIGQGVASIDRNGLASDGREYPADGVRSKGGWMAFELGPWGPLTYDVGASIDKPEKNDLNPGMRSSNSSIFGNVYWQINKAVSSALELSYLDTEYVAKKEGECIRIQAAFYYKF